MDVSRNLPCKYREHVGVIRGKDVQRMYGLRPSWGTGSVSNLQLAPDQGFEP